MAILQRGDGSARGGHSTGIGGKRATFSRATLAAVLTSTSLGVLSLAMPAVAQVRAESVSFDIPSQPINEALVAFARQASVRLVMPDAQFGDVRSNAVRGAYDRETALAELLRGTGVAARLENGAIVLQRSADASRATQRAAPNASEEPFQVAQATPPRTTTTDTVIGGRGRASDETDDDADTVIIVGTNIRGVYPSSSPVEVYTAEDIARTGATTTEQFIQKLPQNFGTRNQFAPGAIAQGLTGNREGVNSVDLRGLGASTTLTLLNGRRLALANNGQAADISLIPMSAIERVEVLTDGASAIYGSDAIGGVVNFVLRDDFDGTETRVAYGGVTSGGLRQGEVSQTLGADWLSGHGLITAAASSFSTLKTTDRDYAAPTGAGTLTPIDQRNSALASVSQNVGDRIELNSDLAFSSRSVKNTASAPGESARYISDTEQYFGNFGVDVTLNPQLEASFLATYSNVDVDSTLFQEFAGFGSFVTDFSTEHTAYDLTAQLSGTALELPAGPMLFSLGVGYMDENARGARGTAPAVPGEIGRTTTYAFGELLIPLVGQPQGIPFVQRLELSLAARYTSHEDTSAVPLLAELGSDTVPKVGLLWTPFEGLNLRGTYGESFRAPFLSELDPSLSLYTLRSQTVAGVSSPVLLVQGTSQHLVPETSESYTLGLDYRPSVRPQASFSATYFNIDYTNQIQSGSPFGTAARALPASYPDWIYHPSSAGQIEEILRLYPNTGNTLGIDLSNLTTAANTLLALSNLWILDLRYRNLLASNIDGLDISFDDSIDTQWGSVHYGINTTRIFAYRQQTSASAPTTPAVDVVGRPADLRGRVYLGATGRTWDTTLSANYVDDYDNPFAPGGAQPVDSWLTFDFVANYRFPTTTLGLSIQNVFDEEPPSVATSAVAGIGLRDTVGFDPSNANPLGRLIVVSLTQRW